MTTEGTNPAMGSSAQPEQTQETQETPEVKASWFDSIPDEYKENKSVSLYKDKELSDFVKDYVNKDSMVGKKGVILPDWENAEDVQRYYKEIGVPETHDSYKMPEFEVPEELAKFVDTGKLESFKELAHKHGLNEKQFDGVMKDYMAQELGTLKRSYDEQIARSNDVKTQLRNEWGEKTDERIERAQTVINELAPEESYEFFNENNKNPGLIKFLDNIAQKISPDSLKGGVNQAPKISAQEAKQRMADILKNDAYFAAGIPSEETKLLRKEYAELSRFMK